MKKNRKLIFAWWMFATIIALFLVATKILYERKKQHGATYQCKILIDKDLLSRHLNERSLDDSKKPQSKEQNEKKVADEDLFEITKYGHIPKITPDGASVFDVYSAKFDGKDRKKVCLVISIEEIGINDFAEAIKALGSSKVSFIVPVYLDNFSDIIDIIIKNGHEFFVQFPTQTSIPEAKKGKVSTFFANADPKELVDKLLYLLASAKYSLGVANGTLTLLTKSVKDMSIISEELSKRGLIFLDLDKSNEVAKELSQNSDFVYIGAETVFPKNSKIVIPFVSDGEIFSIHVGGVPDFMKEISKYNDYSIAPVSSLLKK
jgi:polysaccharide deacetylase 2 family uncharacterized protein YibQ